MPNLKDIRRRIQSIITTQQTTNAMKLVSAAKLRRAQVAIQNFRPYANQLNTILQQLAIGTEIHNPFFEERQLNHLLVVLITSNKGLAGAFNSAIIRVAVEHVEKHYSPLLNEGKVHVLCIGKKGYDYFKKQKKFQVVGNQNWDVYGKHIEYAKVEHVANRVMEGFIKGEWDRVELIYNRFKNPAVQIRSVEPYLPVTMEKTGDQKEVDYLFEPRKEEVLNLMVPRILRMRLYGAVLDSFASEHGARMVAMDNATTNAKELLKELRLQYNKARQEAITKELLDIVGGANALEQMV